MKLSRLHEGSEDETRRLKRINIDDKPEDSGIAKATSKQIADVMKRAREKEERAKKAETRRLPRMRDQ